MKRQIIKIDENKCNGCGKCVTACHEGAIGMVNGKAKLLRDDYCDGLGNCLPACPAGAITFEEREAKPFDMEAVKAKMERLMKSEFKEEDITKRFDSETSAKETKAPCGCPGTAAKTIQPDTVSEKGAKLPCGCPGTNSKSLKPDECSGIKEKERHSETAAVPSQLRQWPVQIKLVPVNAPYFENADLLVAADCSAYSCGDFHNKYMKGKIVIIGCPKLDNTDYTEKLAAILQNNDIKSLTVVRMEVPCCSGIVNAALEAVKMSGKSIKTEVVVLKIGK